MQIDQGHVTGLVYISQAPPFILILWHYWFLDLVMHSLPSIVTSWNNSVSYIAHVQVYIRPPSHLLLRQGYCMSHSFLMLRVTHGSHQLTSTQPPSKP